MQCEFHSYPRRAARDLVCASIHMNVGRPMRTADDTTASEQPEVGTSVPTAKVEEGFSEAAACFAMRSPSRPLASPAPHFAARLHPLAGGVLVEAPERTLARLRKALRRERARGRSGHFTYDLARHLALAQEVRTAEASMRAAALSPPRRGKSHS